MTSVLPSSSYLSRYDVSPVASLHDSCSFSPSSRFGPGSALDNLLTSLRRRTNSTLSESSSQPVPSLTPRQRILVDEATSELARYLRDNAPSSLVSQQPLETPRTPQSSVRSSLRTSHLSQTHPSDQSVSFRTGGMSTSVLNNFLQGPGESASIPIPSANLTAPFDPMEPHSVSPTKYRFEAQNTQQPVNIYIPSSPASSMVASLCQASPDADEKPWHFNFSMPDRMRRPEQYYEAEVGLSETRASPAAAVLKKGFSRGSPPFNRRVGTGRRDAREGSGGTVIRTSTRRPLGNSRPRRESCSLHAKSSRRVSLSTHDEQSSQVEKERRSTTHGEGASIRHSAADRKGKRRWLKRMWTERAASSKERSTSNSKSTGSSDQKSLSTTETKEQPSNPHDDDIFRATAAKTEMQTDKEICIKFSDLFAVRVRFVRPEHWENKTWHWAETKDVATKLLICEWENGRAKCEISLRGGKFDPPKVGGLDSSKVVQDDSLYVEICRLVEKARAGEQAGFEENLPREELSCVLAEKTKAGRVSRAKWKVKTRAMNIKQGR